ncbi:MAG TPA: hypothetical protein VJS63_17590 [Bradyrhizobium sp.]|nr:hypothetical protein [Bradyrhizobium sp.]
MLTAFWGMAMRWFGKTNHTEIWDEPIAWPIGDIEAVHRIRDICRAAADSAEKLGGSDVRAGKKIGYEVERYERAAKAAMKIAMKVSDDLMRDAAVREIVELCLKANDLKTARPLFRAIQAKSISDDMLRDHPLLRQ